MTASELRAAVESRGTESHFFSRRSMRFFGDTMRNYGVRAAEVKTFDGSTVAVWELYRRRPVKHGVRTSAYFDRATFARVHAVEGA